MGGGGWGVGGGGWGVGGGGGWGVHTTYLMLAACRSGCTSRRRSRHRRAILGRPVRVDRHTAGKLTRLAKFWVMAMEFSMLSTACHQPPGTNTVSPGSCTNSMVSFTSGLALMRGNRL